MGHERRQCSVLVKASRAKNSKCEPGLPGPYEGIFQSDSVESIMVLLARFVS